MSAKEFEITFEDVMAADASMLAQDLERQLREAAPSATISLKKQRPDSQDFGTTLVLVFGTPVAIALAKSVGAFLQRHSGASIRITRSGEVIAKNLDSGDAAKIAEAFAGKQP
jgi:hypothetical protein